MSKAKLLQIIPDFSISQDWDRDSGFGEIRGSTDFFGLFSDGVIRLLQNNEWIDTLIPTEVEVKQEASFEVIPPSSSEIININPSLQAVVCLGEEDR